MAEVAGGMLLVRTLVLRKAHVSIDAEHRAAVRPRVGGEALRDFRELRRHGGNERAHRRLHAVAEALLVRFEPWPLVMRLQLAEEGEEILGKTLKSACHLNPYTIGCHLFNPESAAIVRWIRRGFENSCARSASLSHSRHFCLRPVLRRPRRRRWSRLIRFSSRPITSTIWNSRLSLRAIPILPTTQPRRFRRTQRRRRLPSSRPIRVRPSPSRSTAPRRLFPMPTTSSPPLPRTDSRALPFPASSRSARPISRRCSCRGRCPAIRRTTPSISPRPRAAPTAA